MAASTVSAIIVAYNSGPLLIECIQAVLDSSIPVTVVVSDNGSTDGTLDVVAEMAADDCRVSLLRNGVNLGFARANNRAVALSDSAFVLFLNPDCLVAPDTIAIVVNALMQRSEAGMAGCQIVYPDGSDEPNSHRRIPTLGMLVRGLLAPGWVVPEQVTKTECVEAISGAFMLVRREVLLTVGLLDERYFMHWEDLDFCKRLQLAGLSVLYVPETEVVHFKGRSSAALPLKVELYKHLGLARFLRKFHFAHVPLASLPIAVAVGLLFVLRQFRGALKRQMTLADQKSGGSSFAETASELTVIGARSPVGRYLILRLIARRTDFVAVSRRNLSHQDTRHLKWVRGQLEQMSVDKAPKSIETLVHLAPIYLLPQALELLAKRGLKRVIALSSVSLQTKLNSEIPSERELARKIAAAETQLEEICRKNGVRYVILRCTMIYSGADDKNVSRLFGLIRLFRTFPLAGKGTGLRQPVHADDVAIACDSLLNTPGAWNCTYVLSGGEVLSYRQMLARIAERAGRTLRVVEVPSAFWGIGLLLLRRIPMFHDVNLAMLRRVDRDLDFSHGDARARFRFNPRGFMCLRAVDGIESCKDGRYSMQ